MQPLPAAAGHHQHVRHHLLPAGPRQVRLPPGLPLQVLPAQLRRGWEQTASVSTQTFSGSTLDGPINVLLESKFAFDAPELHCEVVTRRPKTPEMQRIRRLPPMTEVCLDSTLCFRTLCSGYHLLFGLPKTTIRKTRLQQIQEKKKEGKKASKCFSKDRPWSYHSKLEDNVDRLFFHAGRLKDSLFKPPSQRPDSEWSACKV